MKKLRVFVLGILALTLITGCGEKEKTLVCSNSQSDNGVTIDQEISMTFKNDKVNRVKMDMNSKATDDTIKANWSMFTSLLDSQYEETDSNGVTLKKSSDDKNYSYRITLEIDLDKATEDDLTKYGLSSIADATDTMADVKKSAEEDGYTCTEK